MNSVYIFKVNAILKPEHLEKLRGTLEQQIKEGLVLIDARVEFLSHELEKFDSKIKVELVETIDSKHETICENIL